MSIFKIGDTAIAKETYLELVKGGEYIVSGVDKCSCENPLISLSEIPDRVGGSECHICDIDLNGTWFWEKRFEKPAHATRVNYKKHSIAIPKELLLVPDFVELENLETYENK